VLLNGGALAPGGGSRAPYKFDPLILMLRAPQLRAGSPPVRVVIEPSAWWDTESSTAQTIGRMCEGIRRAAADPYFSGAARAIPWRSNGLLLAPATLLQQVPAASRQQAGVAIADWWWVRHFIHFTEDSRILAKLGGDPNALEALIDPAVMIRMVHPEGDCDCFSMFLAGLLECQGLDWQIVTLACSRRQPGIWSHVFPRLVLDGLYIPLDASHGKFPGWSVPARDIQRFQAWDKNGDPVNPDGSTETEVI
jgi:hypothetical protein